MSGPSDPQESGRAGDRYDSLARLEQSLAHQAEVIERQGEQLSQIVEIQRSVSVMQRHSGPIPSPEVLSKYKDGHPEFYEAILKRYTQQTEGASLEQAHRHRMDERNLTLAARGQAIAWVFMFLCLFAAVGFTAAGLPTAGLVAAIGAIGTLAANVVNAKGKSPQLPQREEGSKAKESTPSEGKALEPRKPE